jgi:hypothetical protein
MDYKFRFYSPLLGRFILPDTITPGGPQGLNRYSYVNNNPINFNDPTGHCVVGGHEMPDSSPACDHPDPNDKLKEKKRDAKPDSDDVPAPVVVPVPQPDGSPSVPTITIFDIPQTETTSYTTYLPGGQLVGLTGPQVSCGVQVQIPATPCSFEPFTWNRDSITITIPLTLPQPDAIRILNKATITTTTVTTYDQYGDIYSRNKIESIAVDIRVEELRDGSWLQIPTSPASPGNLTPFLSPSGLLNY